MRLVRNMGLEASDKGITLSFSQILADHCGTTNLRLPSVMGLEASDEA